MRERACLRALRLLSDLLSESEQTSGKAASLMPTTPGGGFGSTGVGSFIDGLLSSNEMDATAAAAAREEEEAYERRWRVLLEDDLYVAASAALELSAYDSDELGVAEHRWSASPAPTLKRRTPWLRP